MGKHEEQQDIVSKLQQELVSLVEGEKHNQEHELELKNFQDQDKDSGRSLEKAVTGASTTEEQGKDNKAVGTGSVVNGGEQNTATGSLSVVGGGRKNTASDTMSVVGGGEKNKAALLAVKRMEPKEELPLLVGVKTINALVHLVLSVVDLKIKSKQNGQVYLVDIRILLKEIMRAPWDGTH